MKIGMIGLGIMGLPMAKNLIRAGYKPVIPAGHAAKAVRELEGSAKIVENAFQVGAQCDVLITMVPDMPQTRDVLFGAHGAAYAMKPGSIVIDCSSVSPIASRELQADLDKYGIDLLDAPVSGGEPGAVNGTLAFMVGGKQSAFERVRPLFMAMGASCILCGGTGAGSTTKLCNQIIVAANIAGLAEALMLGQCSGVSPVKICEAISGGLAGSTVLNAKSAMMTSHDFTPGGRLELHIKDLKNTQAAAQECSSPIPLTLQILEMMKVLKRKGMEKADHSVLLAYYEQLCGQKLGD